MTRYPKILVLLLSILAVSCVKIQPESRLKSAAITFSGVMANDGAGATKATGEITTPDNLHEADFGVFACYTGLHRYSESNVSSDFMHDQQVSWNYDQSVWEYFPVKYWPNGEGEADRQGVGESPRYVSFFAYGPYSDGDGSDPVSNPAGYCIPGFCHPQETTDPWLMYRINPDPEHQVDLLYAVPLLDQTKTTVQHAMQFEFRHALACVGDDVRLSLSDELKEAYNSLVGTHFEKVQVWLTGVKITYYLTEKAKLVLWNRGQANWQAVQSENSLLAVEKVLMDTVQGDPEVFLYSYDGERSFSGTWSGSGAGVFYIPVEQDRNPQRATITLRYVVRSTQGGEIADLEHEGNVTFYLKEYYQEGKKLDINITLNQ